MVRLEFVGIGVLLVLSVVFGQSAFAGDLSQHDYTNDVGGISNSSGINVLDLSTVDSVVGIFGESFFDNSTDTMHTIWWDDTTPDDLVFYSSITDGITNNTPILIYTGGGGGFPSVEGVEVISSGNDVFVNWLIQENATHSSLLQKYSANNGATFSNTWFHSYILENYNPQKDCHLM